MEKQAMDPRRHPAEPTVARLLAALAVAVLAGCAGIAELQSEVVSYGSWPSARAPGSYVFERSPSQQAHAALQDSLEQSAAPALAAAGFQAATDRARADVVVQIGARSMLQYYGAWGDPWWWRGYGYAPYWRGAWWGPYPYGPWGPYHRYGYGYGWGGMWPEYSEYEREVALLIRDRASGEPLYETRARSNGYRAADTTVLSAMYRAAMSGFPQVQPAGQVVVLPLVPAPPVPPAAQTGGR
jgi:hypothetical protein